MVAVESPLRMPRNLSGTRSYEIGQQETPSYRPRKLQQLPRSSSLPPLHMPPPVRETEEQMIREATQFRLGQWIGKHDAERIRCTSTAMAAEMKLRQALAFTEEQEYAAILPPNSRPESRPSSVRGSQLTLRAEFSCAQ